MTLILLLVCAVLTEFAAAGLVTINNTLPRLDVNGNIIDAHDG
jgi:hypothetical protein